jgi:hypothetical protein
MALQTALQSLIDYNTKAEFQILSSDGAADGAAEFDIDCCAHSFFSLILAV